MNASVTSQKTRRKLHRNVFERIKELMNQCESKNFETQVN